MTHSTLYVVADRDGRSTFIEEGRPPSNPFNAVDGFDAAIVWGTGPLPSTNWNDRERLANDQSVMPQAGGTRLWLITFPPDAVMAAPEFDPGAAGAEYAAKLPGLAQCFEVDHPGMHTTDTVDYDLVIDGELTLEVDGGESRVLRRGDIVVQHGTRHAWRNRSDKPATIVAVLIGARRPE